MKELIKAAAAWAAMICAVPAVLNMYPEPAAPASAKQSIRSITIPSETILIAGSDADGISELSLEEYTVYAVLAEIPYITNEEAMKAQAVAARTYAVRRILSGADPELDGAHISDDPEKYQICLTDEQARIIYGSGYEAALAAAERAASDTCREILTYDGVPIIAAFHTSSGGMTESAENVWGTAKPYLTAAVSEGDLYSPYYDKKKVFTAAELYARMRAEYGDASGFDGFSDIITTSSGTVLSVTLCGKTVSGTELARILTLDSAAFSCGYDEDTGTAIFTVNGCGHLAGMSIYGADYMAENGADYGEILAHYYSGVQLTRYSTN